MKRTYSVIGLLIVMFLSCGIIESYGQCGSTKCGNVYGRRNRTKAGIALVRVDSTGQHAIPTAAMSLPTFKGGNREMNRFIHKNKQYPADLHKQGISGTTLVQAVVKADSTVADVKVVKSSGYQQFDDEAVRLVKSFPHMMPATQNCEAVDMTVQFPIAFTIDDKK